MFWGLVKILTIKYWLFQYVMIYNKNVDIVLKYGCFNNSIKQSKNNDNSYLYN